MAAFDALIKAGKVRAIGASNYTGARLGEALRIGSARACPVFLTGQRFPDGQVSFQGRPREEQARRTRREQTRRSRLEEAALDEVSAELQSTTRVSLAWLLAKPSVTAPIASAKSLSQLQELLASPRLKLGASAIERLNRASA